jgi:hypothetical protein
VLSAISPLAPQGHIEWADGNQCSSISDFPANRKLETHMDAHHLSLHRVPGITGLPDDADVELMPSDEEGGARAFLTVNRDAYYLHLRRMQAIGRIISNRFSGRRDPGLSVEEEFNKILSATQVTDSLYAGSPLLIVEVRDTIEVVELREINSFGLVGYGLKLFDDSRLVQSAKRSLEAAIAGLCLGLPSGNSQEIKEIKPFGSVSYLVEPLTGQTVYSLSSNPITAEVRVSSSVTPEMLALAAKYARSLRDEERLQTVIRLLSQSTLATDNHAWAGLEVFMQVTFKDVYEPLAFKTVRDASPPARAPFITRLREVMKDKYNIRDKFVVIASELDIADANSDIQLFICAKDKRDAIHKMSVAPEALPIHEARHLLRKYLQTHLDEAKD